MSKLVPYAQESREQITKSAINQSTSKTLWSFAKNRRFSAPKPACPYVSYIHNLSTISNRKAGFGTSKRRVFTEVSESPSSDAYNPQKQQLLTTPIFAESRHNCVANSYLTNHPEQIPGPGRYESASEEKGGKGFSMRPKTANNRTYFVDNKELKIVPSPFQYQNVEAGISRETMSKFRSVTLGNVTLQSKNQRFKESFEKTPGPFVYHPKKYAITKFSRGGKMGRCNRLSFVDHARNTSYTPGPGKYEAPTEFAHYKSKGSP